MVNSFSDRRIWLFAVNRADCGFCKHSGSWISCELWRGFRIVPILILNHLLVLTKLDHRSFLSLGGYVNELIQIISFFGRSSFKLRCETDIVIVQAVV